MARGVVVCANAIDTPPAPSLPLAADPRRGGCASVDRGLKLRLDSLIGKANKEEMIERYGEPVQKTTVDSHTDVWEFVASDSRSAPAAPQPSRRRRACA
jgi:hypothetical protein